MKILFLDQYGELGGAQRCLLDLLPGLQARGWRPVVAAPAGPLLHRAARFGPTEELCLPEMRSTRKRLRDWVRFALGAPAAAAVIERLVARHAPLLIYVNGPRLVLPLSLLRTKLPCVFHSHHFITQASVRRPVKMALGKLRAAVIANCKYVARQWDGLPVTVVYNGVEGLGYRAPARPVRLGVVGRVCAEKGQRVFVEAVRRLPQQGCTYSVIGAPLFADAAAQDYAERLRADAGGVLFPGWLEDPLANLDLLIVPSVGAEATTRVVPEAWSAGVPVIASNLGGLGEMIEDNRTGFLVEPGSPAALAARIGEVVAAPAERLAAVTLAARREYAQRFTLEQFTGQIAALLARVVQAPH